MFGDLVWLVANARPDAGGIEVQSAEALALLDDRLRTAGSDRASLLSVHVLLADIEHRAVFDRHWDAWIGADPHGWPQRACYGASLAPGLLVEIVATAARTGSPRT